MHRTAPFTDGPHLPRAFVTTPLAHRAYHDRAAGRPENSIPAIRAAVDMGYGIEIDLQMSSDGQAMVFHDYDLARLTGETGAIQQRSAAQLGQIQLTGGDAGCTIPTLQQVLQQVKGQVPLLIEIKDQDGALGAGIGRLETATAKALTGYDGPIAVMSFNPNSVRVMAGLAPDVPRGLTTCSFAPKDWPLVPQGTRNRLRDIPDFDSVKASFISHEAADLTRPRVTALAQQGVPILCWTIRSLTAEKAARRHADSITFEGYAAPLDPQPRP